MDPNNPVKLTSSLAKVLHYFCNGFVEFMTHAHLTGILCLITEDGQSVRFSVDEKVFRLDDHCIKIVSNSFNINVYEVNAAPREKVFGVPARMAVYQWIRPFLHIKFAGLGKGKKHWNPISYVRQVVMGILSACSDFFCCFSCSVLQFFFYLLGWFQGLTIPINQTKISIFILSN